MDTLVVQDLIERLEEIIIILNDYEEEAYICLEMANQLMEELQTVAEESQSEEDDM